MVLLEEGVIRQGGRVERITGWEVVFQTPFGWASTREEAVEVVRGRDLDPAACVVPVAAARSETMHEVLR